MTAPSLPCVRTHFGDSDTARLLGTGEGTARGLLRSAPTAEAARPRSQAPASHTAARSSRDGLRASASTQVVSAQDALLPVPRVALQDAVNALRFPL